MKGIVNVAIDGPSGAGKSTVAKTVARKLGIIYLDTGAMYRAAALAAMDAGVSVTDAERVIPVVRSARIDVRYENGVQKVYLNGEDVSERIRIHSVSKAASDISKIPEVRLRLVEMQRAIAAGRSVVADGRDIASYVLPEADVKVYLTASSAERAKRRCAELKVKGQAADFDTVLKDIEDRDYNDMNRKFAPLVQVADAVLIDSSDLTADEVAEKILELVEARCGGK